MRPTSIKCIKDISSCEINILNVSYTLTITTEFKAIFIACDISISKGKGWNQNKYCKSEYNPANAMIAIDTTINPSKKLSKNPHNLL